MTPVLEIKNLVKDYPEVRAVDDISFAIEPGICFGLLGPNGAGKTTLMRILMTLLLPTHGAAKMDGLNVVKDFKKIRKNERYHTPFFFL